MKPASRAVRILGVGAGGGFPQWNCACPNCARVRAREGGLVPRTQDSLALRDGEGHTFLINASPDIGLQMARAPELAPRAGRASPLEGIVLTNGDLDHVLGLFSLRESTPLVVYATDTVRRGLTEQNVIMRTLERFPGQLAWRRLVLGEPTPLTTRAGAASGFSLTAFALPGKVPTHLHGLTRGSPEDNIGLLIHDQRRDRRIVVATAVGAAGPHLERLAGADVCFFDGTFWSSDELIRSGLSRARAEDMAHLPIAGMSGSLRLLSSVSLGRRIYTHINNTNPILDPASAERAEVEAQGWEVVEDGLEIQL